MATSNRTREVVDRAKEVGAATVTVVGQVGASTATAVGSGMKKGLASAKAQIDRASEHVEAENQRWETRKEQTDMPGIGATDPLGDLAIRLDRQADFFRELAIDAMRPGVVRGAMIGLVVVLALVTAGLGVVAIFRAFSGDGAIEGLAALAGAVGAAGLSTGLVGLIVERGRAAVAHEALSRAEQAEARLCRVAELIALEKHDPAALVRTLARTSDGRAPGGAREDTIA
ncbi:MAG: hypothetical protein K1X94_21070 [Sandaracinaceae bacterium]|jgi:hypothetical protein|nr:hypothetical protein [Sandaracinaceae bacterium]